MYALKKLAENINSTDIGKVFVLTFKKKPIKDLVISLNLGQLKEGQAANNRIMPPYSRESIIRYGKRPGPWTLFETGALYKSFKVVSVTDDYILEFGDLVKEPTKEGESGADFEKLLPTGEVLGLNEASFNELIDSAIPVMIEVLLEEWKK